MYHKHDDGQPFRTLTEYAQQYDCPHCARPAGQPCFRARVHRRREALGAPLLIRDRSMAPERRDRFPGACYSTLPGCE